MNVIEVQRGADRKLYPARWPSAGELARMRALSHALVHRDGHTVREAQRIMAESYAVRRSTGSIAGDLRRFECAWCPHVLELQPKTRAKVVQWH